MKPFLVIITILALSFVSRAQTSGCLTGFDVYTQRDGTSVYGGTIIPNYKGTPITYSGGTMTGCRASVSGLTGNCTVNGNTSAPGQNYSDVTFVDCPIDSLYFLCSTFLALVITCKKRRLFFDN